MLGSRSGTKCEHSRVRRWLLAAAVPVAAAGALGGCGSSSKASAPTTAATLDPAAQTNLNCQQALDPWTQYLANTQFQGTMQWISAVGQQSPLVNIPEDGARLFIQETIQVGVNQATNDAYSKVRDECNTFAQSHPGYDFSNVPPAPSSA